MHLVEATSVANLSTRSTVTNERVGMRVDWMHQGFPSPRFVREGRFSSIGSGSCRVVRVDQRPCGPMFQYSFYGGRSLVCTPDTMLVTLLGSARVKQCLDGGLSVVTKDDDGGDVLSMVTSEFPVMPPLVGYEIFIECRKALLGAEELELSRVTRSRIPSIAVNGILLAAEVAPWA